MDLSKWEKIFEEKLAAVDLGNDPAHDLAHFRRVVKTAKALAQGEKAKLEVVVPAAWLHDVVNVPKNDPRRSQASRLSAEEAVKFLREVGYPSDYFEAIAHAIECHSFTAAIEPRTVEAAIVQDADRLDGLGAIGIARWAITGARLGSRIYDPMDAFAQLRPLDDRLNMVDHFYVKLFKTAETLRTQAGREEGAKRAKFMRNYIEQLKGEIG
jgi:uncharacterized protein